MKPFFLDLTAYLLHMWPACLILVIYPKWDAVSLHSSIHLISSFTKFARFGTLVWPTRPGLSIWPALGFSPCSRIPTVILVTMVSDRPYTPDHLFQLLTLLALIVDLITSPIATLPCKCFSSRPLPNATTTLLPNSTMSLHTP